MSGRVLTKTEVDDIRRAMSGQTLVAYTPPPEVARDLLATLDALVSACVDAQVEMGPYCLVCGEGVEADDDPCDVPCSGLTLRRLLHALGSGA